MAITLAQLSDAEKVALLLSELQDAANMLRHYTITNRFQSVIDEIRGEQMEATNEQAE